MTTNDASADRRGEAGFTLIELMVVVVILGVLAAIAVPTYIGMQNGARDASVKTDLVNARTALASYATGRNGSIPAAVTAAGLTDDAKPLDLTRYGWSRGVDTTDLVYSVQGASAWCVLGTSSTGDRFSISTGSTVQGGTRTSVCPARY